jgi:hypothetical protein
VGFQLTLQFQGSTHVLSAVALDSELIWNQPL